jgi:nucleoside-triphosphatase THEP1
MNDQYPACRIVLVIGPKDSGKTSYLKTTSERAMQRGWSVGGFLSVNHTSAADKKNYFLRIIQTGQEKLLASTASIFSQAIHYGEYFFDPKIFELGNKVLKSSIHTDLIIVDEFGPLEQQQTGFYSGFNFLLRQYKGILMIALRPSLQHYLRDLIYHYR